MHVALNISGINIKVLSLKGRQVKKWASLDLAGGLVRDGLILQPEAVGKAINSLFKSTGMPRDRVITSIAGLSFTYRFISLPRMKAALLEEAILRAAKKEISLPLDELYLSWQPLPGQGAEQTYFILGVPRNLVDTAVQALKIASVAPYLMDLQPLALARTANRSDAIVVSLEPDCFDIVFITGGIPTVIHTIRPKGEGATLEDNIRRLADELTKTAAFYQSNHPEVQLSSATPLLLTGELAAKAPASGLLQPEIEYPIEPLVPMVEFPDTLPVAAYTTSIGLALKRMPPKTPSRDENNRFCDININILDGKYRKPKAKPAPARYVWLGIFLITAVVLLFPLYQAQTHLKAENALLETDLSNVSRELNLATLINEETASTEETIREIAATAAAIKAADVSILGTRGNFISGLRLVTGAIPSQASFTSIEIRKEDITIRGEADSVFTVVDYAVALEYEEEFSKIRITSLDEVTTTASGSGETDTPPEVNVITFEILLIR
jgi:hypothetical protein